MMGKDCERILSNINMLKDTLSTQISLLTNTITGQMKIEYKGGNIHGSAEDVSFDQIYDVQEVENKTQTSSFIYPILKIYDKLKPDIDKMKALEDDMYTPSNTFNNSYGSPWKELKMMNESLIKIREFGVTNSEIGFNGQKMVLITLMNTAAAYVVDTKWAMTYYHDYIQRGYDYKYNAMKPSVTFKKGVSSRSIGNVNQSYTENVNIPNASIAPF